jgi:hypothetical protein
MEFPGGHSGGFVVPKVTPGFPEGEIVSPARFDFIAYRPTNNPGPQTSLLLESVPVNVSMCPTSLIQPASQTAVLSLQSSPNLTPWQFIADADLRATNGNRFSRATLTFQD